MDTNDFLKDPKSLDLIPTNDLEKYFIENNKNILHKWYHYFEIYDRHFSKYRGKSINILEIGVFGGGSLQMWKTYFGKDAKIFGIDINPECKSLEEDNVKIFIGSQEDKEFLKTVASEIGIIDILIDDGGHTMKQQIITFESLYNHISENGTYLCEDLHTSYWPSYGGGLENKSSFIEYSKKMIDHLNGWYHNGKNDITKNTYSMHYYDSILVMEKRIIKTPWHGITGINT